jgi:phosphate transport system substrate-binding protein
MSNTKTLSIIAVLIGLSTAQAKHQISGSDTMGGLMTDAIIAAGMDQTIGYVGGGSGVGEKAIVQGEIGITAMSREMKPEAVAQARTAGMNPIGHIVALDGIAVFTNKQNPLVGMDLSTLARVFTCEITSWAQVPGSGKTGAIHSYRRDDLSGTTDTFKTLVGVKKFGACVEIVNETADIAEKTGADVDAIGYAGLSGKSDRNQALGIAKSGNSYVLPTAANIRSANYPLARSLYIYEATGSRTPNKEETQLLQQLLDRSFLDPIAQDHDFVTLD